MVKRLVFCVGVSLLSVIPTVGSAQSSSGQSVADRPRPDYDPIGDRLGAFTLLPAVTITGSATDNYLATDTNRQGDIYAVFSPEAYLRSNWARNRLDARVFLDQSLHARLGGENTTQYGISSSGAYDVSRDAQIHGDISAAHFVESRSALGAFQQSAEPVNYNAYHAGLGSSQVISDLTLNENASIDYLDYHNTRLFDGTPVDQSYRNVRQTTVGGSAQYSFRNGIGLLVSGQYSAENYSVGPGSRGFATGVDLDRDSSGFDLEAGVSLELSRLIFGHLQIGYLNRHYNDPRLRDFSGLSYSGDVLWNVTPLTSLRFRASRSVQDTSSPDVAGNVRSDFSLTVDHELYRYLIVSGDLAYAHFNPNGFVGGPFDYVSGDEYSVGVRARYLVNRRYTILTNLRYSGRSSDSTYLKYHAVVGSVGLRAAF